MKNSWGLYPWFADGTEDKLIHIEDIDKFNKLQPYGKVFQCVDIESRYLVLVYRDKRYRVLPDAYRKIPAPSFVFGQQVKDASKPERLGKIHDIRWHSKQNKPFYHIVVNEKLRSKRYYASDLVSAED